MSEVRAFDGIICIGGEDWWYHNRGHFDFQIMRRLARSVPVLFVNSLGVRMPSVGESRLFLARIGRKLASLKRGLVEAEPGFWVFSPLSVPGAAGAKLSGWALGPQIRLAARRAGISRPLLWVHCPAGASLVGQIPAAGVVLQRTDRFEAFPEGDRALLATQIASLKATADLVVYAAPHLMAEETGTVARQLLVTHGVDLETFVSAGRNAADAGPADMAHLPRPRIGFIGGIDAHTFDPPLFLALAARMPDVRFVLVGGTSLPEGWCPLENVTQLGRKPYAEVARYMAAMDCLIMPWNDSPWIQACNPVKLKEYLATGRPVVTRDFAALDGWRDLVRTAATPDAFEAAVRASLTERRDIEAIAARLASETWDAKAALVLDALTDAAAAKSQGTHEPKVA
ncbi:MAG TPA: glycosyltransferase [Hyphomicrobiaceae bacterium]|nr:glycosyltransferase [Hyphomicrobiaceae bacterium]